MPGSCVRSKHVVDVQMGLGHQRQVFDCPGFEFTQSPAVGHIHAAVPDAPFVEDCVAVATLASHILDRPVGLGLWVGPMSCSSR